MMGRVVDTGVCSRDYADSHLVHGHQMLADYDAGQPGHVRRVDVDCRAYEDAFLGDVGGEVLAEAPFVGLCDEGAVLERRHARLDGTPDALDAMSVRGDRLADPSGLLDYHRKLVGAELCIPGSRSGSHEPARGHHLDQIRAVLVVGADQTAQVIVAVGL